MHTRHDKRRFEWAMIVLIFWCALASVAHAGGWGGWGGGGDDDGGGEETSDDAVWAGLDPGAVAQDAADLSRTRDLLYERELSAAQVAEIDSWRPRDKDWWFDDARDEAAFRAYHRLRALAESETGTLDKLNYQSYDETLGVRIETLALDDGKPVDTLIIDARLRPDLLWRSKLVSVFTDALIDGRWNLFLGAYQGYPVETEGLETQFIDLDQLASLLLGGPLSWLEESDRAGAGNAHQEAKNFIRAMLEELYPERIDGPDLRTALDEIEDYHAALGAYAGANLADEMRRLNGEYLLQDYLEERSRVDAFLARLGVLESEHFFNVLMRLVAPRLVEWYPIKPRAQVAELIEAAELRYRNRTVTLPRGPGGPSTAGIWSVSSVQGSAIGVPSLQLKVIGHLFINRDTGVTINPTMFLIASDNGSPPAGVSQFAELWMGTEVTFTPPSARVFMEPLMHIKTKLAGSIAKDGSTLAEQSAAKSCLGVTNCVVEIFDGPEHEATVGGKYQGRLSGSWKLAPVALPATFSFTTQDGERWGVEGTGSGQAGPINLELTLLYSQTHTEGETRTVTIDSSLFSAAGSYQKATVALVDCEVIDSQGNKVADSCECIENNSCPDGPGDIDIGILDGCPEGAEPGSLEYCACLENAGSPECIECDTVTPTVGLTIVCSNDIGSTCPCALYPEGCPVGSGSEDPIRECRSRFEWVTGDDAVLCVLNNASCDGGMPREPYVKTVPAGGVPRKLKACSNGLQWGPCPDQPPGLPLLTPDIDPAEGFPPCHCVGGVPLFPGCSCGVVETRPDLAVDWIAFSNVSASVGDALQVYLSVRNVGNATAPAASMVVEVESTAGVEDLEPHTGSLPPGQHRVFEFVFDATVPGPHRARVEVDPLDQLPELSEGNNQAFSPELSVAPSGGGFGVDLAVTPLLTSPDNPTQEHQTELEFDVKNLGSQDATGVVYLVRMIGADHLWEARGTLAEVAAGERQPILVELPQVTAGNYTVAVVVDPDEVHVETSEENNHQARTLVVHDAAEPCLPCTSGEPNNQLGDEICFPPSSESWYGDRFRCAGVRSDGSTCSPEGAAPNGWHHIGSACPNPNLLPPGLHPDRCGNPEVCPGPSSI